MTIENLYELREKYDKQLAIAEAKVSVINDIIAMELENTESEVHTTVEVDENPQPATNIFSETTY